MPRTKTWHAKHHHVHHDNTECVPGNEIAHHDREHGTGDKPLCRDCHKLNEEGR